RVTLVALIALKYTQSYSVGLVIDGWVIGMGAGQQSRIRCTRLAAGKADTWWLRQHPRVLGLPFRPDLDRVERDNAIDQYLRDDLTAAEEALWRGAFSEAPTRLTTDERRAWPGELRGVTLGPDALL